MGTITAVMNAKQHLHASSCHQLLLRQLNGIDGEIEEVFFFPMRTCGPSIVVPK